MKNKVTVNIFNQPYIILGDESEEYVQKLANIVDKKIKEVMSSNPRTSVTMAAVLTALNICDSHSKCQSTSDNLREQLKKYYDDAIKARSELDEAKKEIMALKAKLGSNR